MIDTSGVHSSAPFLKMLIVLPRHRGGGRGGGVTYLWSKDSCDLISDG